MTKFSPNYGVGRRYYYYVDSSGNRTPVRLVMSSQLKGANEVVVINPEAGNDFDTLKKVKRHFEILTVAKEANIDSIGNLRDRYMFKMLK